MVRWRINDAACWYDSTKAVQDLWTVPYSKLWVPQLSRQGRNSQIRELPPHIIDGSLGAVVTMGYCTGSSVHQSEAVPQSVLDSVPKDDQHISSSTHCCWALMLAQQGRPSASLMSPSSLSLSLSLSLSFRPSIPSSLFLLPSHPLSVPPSSLYLPPSLSLSPLSLSLTHSVFLQISLLFSLLPSVSPTLFLPPLSLSLFSICFPLSHMQSSHTYTVILSTMDNSLSFPPLPCIFLHTVGTINITSSDIKMINALWLICLLPMESSHTLLRSNKVYFSTLEFDRSSGQISVSTDTGWPPGGRALPDDCREFPDVPNNKYDWNFNVQTLIICTIHINQLVSNCTLYWT